jgi:hypothetical protein
MIQVSKDIIDLAREQRAKLLFAIYEVSGGRCRQIIPIDEAGQKAGITDYHEVLDIAMHLNETGLFHLDGGGYTGHLTLAGVQLVENQLAPLKNDKSDAVAPTIIITAPVLGGVQCHNVGSTQNVTVGIPSGLQYSFIRLHAAADEFMASDLDKEDLLLDLARFGQLVSKQMTPEVQKKALEKLDSIENSFKNSTVGYGEASRHLAEIRQYFLTNR